MRKIIVLAVSVLVLVAAVAFFMRRNAQVVEIDPAAFLPADALLYVDQHRAEARGKRFLASPLGKAITGIDLPGLMRDLGAPADAQANIEKMIADFRELMNNKITAELLGDRFVVAMLPPRGPAAPDADPLSSLRGRFLLCCKPRHGATAMDLLTSIYSGDMETEAIVYGKYTLKRFKNKRVSFVACAVDNWLIAAFDEQALRESLDTFGAGTNSLAGSADFKKIVANLPQAEQIAYLRAEGLTQLAKESLNRAPKQQDAAIAARQLEALAGFTAFAYGGFWRDNMVTERLLISFAPEKMTPVMRKFLTMPPQKDVLLPHLRDNLLFYSYSEATDWSALGDLPAEDRARAEAFSGQSVENLQKMLGDGASRLFVRRGEDGQTLPLPLINFCVAAVEPEKLGDTASAVLAQVGLETTKGKFQDASYQVWNKAPEKNLRLYSAVWRGQWCLGNALDFFKEIIQPPQESASLLAAADFKAVGGDVGQAAQSMAYMRMDELFDLLHDAAGWVATILAVQNRELSERAKLINERVVFPILAGAKMYKRSFGRSVVEGDLLKVDIKTSTAPAENK